MNLQIFFIFGLFLGSFLNTVALRLEEDKPIIFSRSKCPKCDFVLKWHNLIPVLSFIFQGGKCSNCFERISFRYPLMELFNGFFVYFLAKSIFLIPNFTLQNSIVIFVYYLVFLSAFFILALIDFKTKYIDERVVYFTVIFWLIFQIALLNISLPKIFFTGQWFEFFMGFLSFPNSEFLSQIFLAVLSTFPFLFLFIITFGRGIGLGDVKIAFMMGLFLRPGDLIVSFLSAIILGGVISIFIWIKSGKLRQEIPYVPFLFLGTLIAMFFGETIITYYFKMF